MAAGLAGREAGELGSQREWLSASPGGPTSEAACACPDALEGLFPCTTDSRQPRPLLVPEPVPLAVAILALPKQRSYLVTPSRPTFKWSHSWSQHHPSQSLFPSCCSRV